MEEEPDPRYHYRVAPGAYYVREYYDDKPDRESADTITLGAVETRSGIDAGLAIDEMAPAALSGVDSDTLGFRSRGRVSLEAAVRKACPTS